MSFVLNDKNQKLYTLKNTIDIPENRFKIYELSHIKTKSKILLYETSDDNKVFNICFKTPVENEKGTPHILEHSVLCGSKKYNVKDPFVELAKSSLNTFLNAMTFPDKTCYPVASENMKDFQNLMDVYLDAVFFPNIYTEKNIFLQEGWHYEIENENDDLKLNGVVLNEMKGVYSSPQSLLETSILKSLYSGTNYGYESGGDPDVIKDLSLDEFLDFHKKFYSPTNSIISLYGNMDFNERLEYLDREYLSKFEYEEKNVVDFDDYIFDKNNNKKSKDIIIYYNAAKIEKDSSIISYNFSLSDEKNNLKHIVLSVLDYILFNQEGAIIKDKLLEMGLGQAIDTMNEPGFTKGFYSIIAHNIDENKKELFKNTIDAEIKNIIENGIEPKKLEAGINIVKFNYIENDTAYPKGLHFILTTLDSYLYDKNIDAFIKFKNSFDIIEKEDLTNKNNIFIKVLKEVFVDNKEKSISIVAPKVNLLKDKEEKNNQYLKQLKDELSKSELAEIIENTKRLKNYQMEKDEDFSCLPKLSVSDIDRNKKIIDYQIKNIDDKKVVYTDKKMNDLVYIGVSFECIGITNIEIYLLGLLTKLITKIGTKKHSYKELNDLIDLHTGLFAPSLRANNEKIYFRMNIKTLMKNIKESFNILSEVLTESLFDDKDRILTILQEFKTESNITINAMGHKVCFSRAGATIDRRSELSDKTLITGISFNNFLNELCRDYDKYKSQLSTALTNLYKRIVNVDNILFDLCMDSENYNEYEKEIKIFINDISNKQQKTDEKVVLDIDTSNYERNSDSEAFLTDNDVNFVSRVGQFDKNKFTAVLHVMRTILNFEYLWTNIRVLGGAYGTASRFDLEGFGGFITFRDPNLKKSDEVFLGIYDYFKNLNIDYDTIEKYIIGTIAPIDNPVNDFLSHDRNLDCYLNNRTNEMINRDRCVILDTKLKNIQDAAEVIKSILDTNQICSMVAVKSEEEARTYYKNVRRLMIDGQ